METKLTLPGKKRSLSASWRHVSLRGVPTDYKDRPVACVLLLILPLSFSRFDAGQHLIQILSFQPTNGNKSERGPEEEDGSG